MLHLHTLRSNKGKGYLLAGYTISDIRRRRDDKWLRPGGLDRETILSMMGYLLHPCPENEIPFSRYTSVDNMPALFDKMKALADEDAFKDAAGLLIVTTDPRDQAGLRAIIFPVEHVPDIQRRIIEARAKGEATSREYSTLCHSAEATKDIMIRISADLKAIRALNDEYEQMARFFSVYELWENRVEVVPLLCP